ncbi:ubiquitin-like 1-activating enzyme E1 A, partial [Phenoliferia sp. Uapishka_3]
MRTSSVLLYTLRGIATEIAKNIVLAGIGNITLVDEQDVTEEDLGANFFLREEDLGKKRVEAAAPRIQALNPRVNVKTETDAGKMEDEAFVAGFDLVVVTDVDAPTLLKVNALTRKLGKKLFAASSIGMDGWIFADLLEHDYMINKSKTAAGGGDPVITPTRQQKSYVPFSVALENTWEKSTKRAVGKVGEGLWGVLATFKTQIGFPGQPLTVENLTSTASTHLPSLGVDPSLLSSASIARIVATAPYEFPPSTAILGGICGQDVLNALGGKEEPVRNLLVFVGETGAGNVYALGC